MFQKIIFTFLSILVLYSCKRVDDKSTTKIEPSEELKAEIIKEEIIEDPINDRVENHLDHYDFILSRAVTRMDKFYKLVYKNFEYNSSNKIKNGIISLKGGNLDEELKDFDEKNIYDINEYFNYEFFQTKKIIYIPFQK